MSFATVANMRVVPEPFGRTVQQLRRLLADAGLSVVETFDVASDPFFQPRIGSRSCVVLLVDTPGLLFEAIALDRAGAVFLPIHIVISGGRDTSCVHWANPAANFGLRPPAPAKAPLADLCLRVTRALSQLPSAMS